MKEKEYTLSAFYLLLKLGLWHSGKVFKWGYVETCNRDNAYVDKMCIPFFRTKPKFPLAKKQLGIGIYLLNTSLVEQNVITNDITHIVEIAVCKTTMAYVESIYYLKVRNKKTILDFRELS